QRGTDRLCVVVMHDLDLAFRFFEKVAVMDRGRIIASGHAQDIFDDDRLDAAFGVRFERLKAGRHSLLRPTCLCGFGPPALGFLVGCTGSLTKNSVPVAAGRRRAAVLPSSNCRTLAMNFTPIQPRCYGWRSTLSDLPGGYSDDEHAPRRRDLDRGGHADRR